MIAIQKVKSEEILKVKELLSLTWKDTYGKYYSDEAVEKITSKWHDPKLLKTQLKDPDIYFAKALDEKKNIVGIITLSNVNGETLFLHRLYVHPSSQGRGVGSQLLQSGLNYFSKAKKLKVECEKQNDKACAFYLKKGFKIVEEKNGQLEGVKIKTVIFEKNLQNST